MASRILLDLAEVLETRKAGDPESSYVAGLFERGLDAIVSKVDEEAAEAIAAATAGDNEQLVYETADLWFHTLVMLSYRGLGPQHVLHELSRRFGVSGLRQKADRNG